VVDFQCLASAPWSSTATCCKPTAARAPPPLPVPGGPGRCGRPPLVAGKLEHSPLRDSVAAVSVGIVGGQPLLDLDYLEDSGAAVDMNIVMTGDGRFVELQGTAEDEPFTDSELEVLRELGRQGAASWPPCSGQLGAGMTELVVATATPVNCARFATCSPGGIAVLGLEAFPELPE